MKGSKDQTTTQKLDPATQAMQEEVFRRAQEASGQPYTPYTGQTVAGTSGLSESGVGGMYNATNQYDELYDQNLGLAGRMNPYLNAGASGAAALGGSRSAQQNLFNPYESQVVDATGAQYDRMRDRATLEANDAATAGGAFGGSRHGIAEGARLGELDASEGSTMADLRYKGYNDMMGYAGQAANLGLGAAGVQGNAYGQAGQAAAGGLDASKDIFNAGDYFRQIQQQQLDDQHNRFNEARDWDVRNLDILKGGMTGMPYGTSTSQPTQRNAAAGILGGAASGMALGGPLGAAAGGLLGLFG